VTQGSSAAGRRPTGRWLSLTAAIGCEVAGSLALKGALGRPALYAVVVVGYLGAFTFLARTLKAGLPLGVAYGIWGAIGVALTAGLGVGQRHVVGRRHLPGRVVGVLRAVVGGHDDVLHRPQRLEARLLRRRGDGAGRFGLREGEDVGEGDAEVHDPPWVVAGEG